MVSRLPHDPAAHDAAARDPDPDEAEWLLLFHALDQQERDAIWQIVRTIVGGRRPPSLHLPIGVSVRADAGRH